MPTVPLNVPTTDPTPLFDAFRGNYQTEILTAAVKHFGVFERLRAGDRSFEELAHELSLKPRAANVLLTGLCAMNLLVRQQRFERDIRARAGGAGTPAERFSDVYRRLRRHGRRQPGGA